MSGVAWNGVSVHEILAAAPRPRLEDVAARFFEGVLKQKLSDEPVKVVDDP